MISKLKTIADRYKDLSQKLTQAEVVSDPALFAKTAKEASDCEEAAGKYEEYSEMERQMEAAEEAAKTEEDPEMRAMFEDDAFACRKALD